MLYKTYPTIAEYLDDGALFFTGNEIYYDMNCTRLVGVISYPQVRPCHELTKFYLKDGSIIPDWQFDIFYIKTIEMKDFDIDSVLDIEI